MKKITLFLFVVILGLTTFAQPYNVTFEVTVPDSAITIGNDIFIAGDLAPVTNWEMPGSNASLKLALKPGTTDVYTITLALNAGNILFKFSQATTTSPSWDNGEWPGDPNRSGTITGNSLVTAIWADQGSTVVTPISALNEVKNTTFVYPSIATEFINIQAIGNVKIFDLCGRNILDQNNVDNQTIDVSNFQTGIYFVKLENKEGIKVQKIIKQ